MKNNICFFCLLILIVSCNNTQEEKKKNINNEDQTNIQTKKSEELKSNTPKTSSSTDSNYGDITTIKKWFGEINASISNYKKKENTDIDIYKDSTPDKYSYESEEIYQLAMVHLERYYENNELKKAVVKFDGHQEDQVSEYYFWNNSLFFVYKTKVYYSKPKSSDDFAKSNKETAENRFYFQNDKLIRWLDNDKNQVDLADAAAKKMEEEILSDSYLYSNIKSDTTTQYMT